MSLPQSHPASVKKNLKKHAAKNKGAITTSRYRSSVRRRTAQLTAWLYITLGVAILIATLFIPANVKASSQPGNNSKSDTFAEDTSADDILTTSKSKFCASISSINTAANQLIDHNPTLRHDMVRLGMNAYCYAIKHSQNNLQNQEYLTLVDFSKPSFLKRMFVIDLDSMKIKMALNVAHGKNSGLTTTTSFSNRPQSKESSLGVFTTSQIYVGKHGRSLRLNGLEQGINDNAMRRDVVMHCAPYVSDEFIKTHHRAGRSWGCFAVSPAVCGHLVDLLRNGSILFAFALPEREDRKINPT